MRILFITTRFPYPPVTGDKAVPYHRIKRLARRHQISLLSFIETPQEMDYISEVAPYCSEVEAVLLRTWRSYWNMAVHASRCIPFQVLYYDSIEFRRRLDNMMARNQFDIVHTVLVRAARYTMDMKNVVKVLDMIDALSLNMERRAQAGVGIARYIFRQEATRMRGFEQTICGKFDQVLVVSDIDREHLKAPNVSVIPAGVDLCLRPKALTNTRPTVIFTGNLTYHPNNDAALYLIRDIFPALSRAMPGVRLKIVGVSPSRELLKLASMNPHLEVTGFVPDIESHLLEASVAVCPLRTGGAGMHRKVLEAMACGVPVVASPLVTGIAARPGEEILFASHAQEFVAAVLQILGNPTLAQKLSENGRRLVAERYTWEGTTQQLEQLYERLVTQCGSNYRYAHRD